MYGPICVCPEKDIPIWYPPGLKAAGEPPGTVAVPRRWRVTVRNGGYPAFGGGRFLPSKQSEVTCLSCGRVWRTRGKYAAKLQDMIP